MQQSSTGAGFGACVRVAGGERGHRRGQPVRRVRPRFTCHHTTSDPTTQGVGDAVRRSRPAPRVDPPPKGVWCTALAAACKGEARCTSEGHDADGEGRAVTSFTDPSSAVAADSRPSTDPDFNPRRSGARDILHRLGAKRAVPFTSASIADSVSLSRTRWRQGRAQD